MMTAILPETDTPINTVKIDRFPAEASLTGHEGTIVIRMGLSGITSLQIIAAESTTEEYLRKRLRAAHPILEQLHETVNVPLPQGPTTR